VYNELAVGPVSSFSTRSNDSYITTRVKSRFVDSGKFNAVHVKVVTEAGSSISWVWSPSAKPTQRSRWREPPAT
jgi:hypothetical protein